MSSLEESVYKLLLKFGVTEWLKISNITSELMEKFPNARAAQKIKDSKLYKVLK